MNAGTARIPLIDILRGFAILGTLGTNIWLFAYLGDLNYIVTFQQHEWWGSADTFLRTLFLSLINGKFLGLLAILFGVGLEMKYKQALRNGRAWPGTYLWVSLVLMLEGLLHFLLVMEYDILMGYAAAAIIVALIVKAGDRAIKRSLLIIGSLHILLIALIFIAMTALRMSGGSISMGDMAPVVELYKHGSWWEQVTARAAGFIALRIEVMFTIPLNICLLLTGLLLLRSGAFSPDERGRKLRSRLLRIGLSAGLPLNLLLLVPGGLFDLPVRYLFAPLLSLGYLGLIALAIEKRSTLRLWGWLANTGKMSLSCYVAQNVICSVIFYGWGLDLGGKLGAIGVIGMWLLISVMQILLASLWLSRFKFGPMEASRQKVLRLFTSA
ncbi:DUF418 domain-containing protein [Paenibacillus spongiae]|uniref:DUF418 domain-containing protein n=1 Tax=Paenibacillus spongiae TaxID=2909671 RepID=A0ABY5SBH0_9BACL|nr:DUF418 domain-containing protein [Paenibacillus spongiae]UVI31297.1 DUF418 domain-containing protein [Paenibacillus spongiae]